MEFQTDLARLRSKLELEVEHAESLLNDAEERRRKLEKETTDAEKIEQSHAKFKDLLRQEMELTEARGVHSANAACERAAFHYCGDTHQVGS